MRLFRPIAFLAGVAGAAVLLSCCSHAPPTEPDYSRLTVDSVTFRCFCWEPAPPSQSRGLFDLVLYSGSMKSGPTDEDREVVRQAGGTIVHEFHVPTIRAIMDATDVPSLKWIAHGVTDADDFPVRLILGFKTAITQEDRDFLQDLGATIRGEVSGPVRAMSILIPDRSVPAVQGWDRLSFIETGEIGACPAKPGEGGGSHATR